MDTRTIGDLQITRRDGVLELRVLRPPFGTRVVFAIWLVFAIPFLGAGTFMTGLFLFVGGEWNPSIAPIWHVPIRLAGAAFFGFMTYMIWTGHILGNARAVLGARVEIERAGDVFRARRWIGSMGLPGRVLAPPLACEGVLHRGSRLNGFSLCVRDRRGKTTSPGCMVMTTTSAQAKNLMSQAVPAVREAIDAL